MNTQGITTTLTIRCTLTLLLVDSTMGVMASGTCMTMLASSFGNGNRVSDTQIVGQ